MKKLILVISFIVLSGFLFGFTAPDVKAQTVTGLQVQIQQLMAQIAALQQRIAQLQPQPSIWCHNFNVNLRVGNRGPEVTALQAALQKEGLYQRTISGIFDQYTASAVVAFQEKYASEVLAPWGLTRGTDYVGPTTRNKLNALYECKLIPTPDDQNIKSNFFKQDIIVQSIINGNNYFLSNQKLYTTDGTYNPLSFEFKLINALKQLGVAQLTYSDITGSTEATAAFYKWQVKNGFDVSDMITKEKLLLIDMQLYEREIKDYETAHKYLPYEKFVDAPINEPPKEHLVMIYYNLFNSLPGTIKARLWISIKPNDSYPTVLNLEQFSAFINRFGDPYFGTLLDNQTQTRLNSQQVEKMISQNNYHFIFCGEGYYSRRNIGSCSIDDSTLYPGSIGSDIAEASALAHEFGHGVGEHNMIIQGINKQTHEHFGAISFAYDQDGYIILIRSENNDGEFVSGYAKTNYAEDFAESFSAYLHSARIFRERAKSNIYLKMKYDFLKDNIFGGREYDTGSLDSYNLWQSKNKGLPFFQDQYMQEDSRWAWDYQYPIKATPSITVISPNGGEQWQIGNTYQITWKSQGISKVDISACRSEDPFSCVRIGPNEGVDAHLGKYDWNIKQLLGFVEPGSRLKIRIIEYKNPAAIDFSDRYFSIVSELKEELCGDVNASGKVDMGDVVLLRNHIAYPKQYPISSEWAADVNCNGVIDMGDVILLLNHVGYPGKYQLNCCSKSSITVIYPGNILIENQLASLIDVISSLIGQLKGLIGR